MTTIYTIGHSNHQAEGFLALLHQHNIELVIDVRSSPYSRYVPQANRETLARTLQAAGITYRFMGDRLGGKPNGEIADYDELRVSPGFQQATIDLIVLATEQPTAIMCSEGDYRKCHRHKLISPALLDQNIHVCHIQPDGAIVDEDKELHQLGLF